MPGLGGEWMRKSSGPRAGPELPATVGEAVRPYSQLSWLVGSRWEEPENDLFNTACSSRKQPLWLVNRVSLAFVSIQYHLSGGFNEKKGARRPYIGDDKAEVLFHFMSCPQ